MNRPATNQSRVVQTLALAEGAAARGDFSDALEWLGLVEMLDGPLPTGWEPIRSSWRRGEGSGHNGGVGRG
jgi:hypothetical protein